MRKERLRHLRSKGADFAEWLRSSRIGAGLTQPELAEQINARRPNDTRIYQADVSQWEHGQHVPSMVTCYALIDIFNADPGEVLQMAMYASVYAKTLAVENPNRKRKAKKRTAA